MSGVDPKFPDAEAIDFNELALTYTQVNHISMAPEQN